MTLKEKLWAILSSPDFEKQIQEWHEFPSSRVGSALIAFLCSGKEDVKWHAVTALGMVTARLAETDLEAARNILRRLAWSLNEASGGIGWGSPEAMGEILARHPVLGREYGPILVSYLRSGENFLEFGPLQRGALWAVGRMAEGNPDLAASLEVSGLLNRFLDSPDPLVRGHALWAGTRAGVEGDPAGFEALLEDDSEIRIYEDRKFRSVAIRELARTAREKSRETGGCEDLAGWEGLRVEGP